MQLLVLCTANICRSPMAERFLRQAAADRAADATITSAGLLDGGRAASQGTVNALATYGIDLDDHHSRRVDAALIRATDLVVAMEVRHVREAAVLAPDRFGSIFTLRELVRRSTEAGPRNGRPLDHWLAELSRDRSANQLLKAHDLDVDDPYGGPSEGYVATAELLHDLSGRLADALWGPA